MWREGIGLGLDDTAETGGDGERRNHPPRGTRKLEWSHDKFQRNDKFHPQMGREKGGPSGGVGPALDNNALKSML